MGSNTHHPPTHTHTQYKIITFWTHRPTDLGGWSLYEFHEDNPVIEDSLRIAFSRFRLSAHRLRCETGRWNKVPPERRICPHCDGATIQNEQHIFACPAVQLVCANYNISSFADLAHPTKQTLVCLKLCLKILEANNDHEPE